jgi:hypothetical protein
MVRLVLDMLRDRQPGGAVPFLVSLASWNPQRQDLHGWLADQLTVGRPALKERAQRSDTSFAENLLDAGLIVPLLDGLDEVPEAVRGPAIARMNDALTGQVTVVTCRTADYCRAVNPPGRPEVRLRGAAAIQLDPLTAETIAAYLVADAGGLTAAARWNPVLKALRQDTPVGQALTTPLMAGLARTIYNPRADEFVKDLRDPAELCAPELADRNAVEAHLFRAFISACYRAMPGWTAQQARRWLAFLAHHLEVTIGGTDLAWWLLRQSTPFADHERPPGRFQRKPPMPTPVPASRIRIRPAKVVTAVVAGIVVGAALAMLVAAGNSRNGSAHLTPGQVLGGGIGFAVLIALVGVIIEGIAPVPHDLKAAVSPRALVTNDRRISLALIFATAVCIGVASLLISGLGWGSLITGFLAGAVVGIILVGLQNPWSAYTAGTIYLALRGMLPWPLMDFLEDAHHRGVLRQAGAVYQFRHIELQRQLAAGYEEPPLQWWQWSQQARRLKVKMREWLFPRWRTNRL